MENSTVRLTLLGELLLLCLESEHKKSRGWRAGRFQFYNIWLSHLIAISGNSEEFERSIEDLQNEIRRLKEHLQPLETQLAEKDEELRYMKRKLSEELKANNTLVKAIERKNEDHVEIMKALKIDSSKLRLQARELERYRS